MKIHSDLTDYHIYLACDLTPKTARTRNDGSPYAHGVQDWETFETKMNTHVSSLSRSVKIHRHTLSDIFSEISKPECVGLVEFWFGGFQITTQKLKDWWKNAFDELGERYHPEDHVELSASVIFKALARDNWLRDQKRKIYDSYHEQRNLTPPSFWPQEYKDQVDDFEKRLSYMIEDFDPLKISIDQVYPYSDWHRNVQECRGLSYEIQDLRGSFADQELDKELVEKNATFFGQCRDRISPVHDILSALDIRVRTLSSWVMKEFNLVRNAKNPREILNTQNVVVARDIPRADGDYSDHGYGLVVRKDFLEEVLSKKKLHILFSVTGERAAWTNEDTTGSSTRRDFYAFGIGFELDHLSSWHEDRDNRT